jgi:DNA-binding transcriptional regulator YbjK
MSIRPDRRLQLLDATLALIAEGGLGAVTHRAVEAAAGLPHGSTTYYFKTREALIDAAVQRLRDRDHAAVDAIGHEIAMALASRGEALDYARIAAGMTAWVRASRDQQLARFELTVASTRRQEIADALAEGRETFVRLVLPIVVAAGSRDPDRDARTLLAMLDGLVLHKLTAQPADAPPPVIEPEELRRLIESFAPA